MSIFNPVYFIYLNPELCVSSNIYSVESAQTYWAQNNSDEIWTSLDVIPSGFDTAGFIGNSKNVIDISTLNSNIATELLRSGSISNLDHHGTYAIPTMYYTMYNTGPNTFSMNIPFDDTIKLSACNLIVGDKIRVLKNQNLPVHFTVSTVDYVAHSFTVDGSNFYEPEADFILNGIKLYDPIRLSKITFLRMLTTSNLDADLFVQQLPEFNYELYNLLYPDSRTLTKEYAFIDYVNRLGNNDPRITTYRDIQNNKFTTVEDLTITRLLKLDFQTTQSKIKWNNVNLYFVTNKNPRPLPSLNYFRDGLITEFAIKTYIRDLSCNSELSNLVVKGNAFLSNTLQVYKNAYFSNEVHVDSNVYANCNVYVSSNMHITGDITVNTATIAEYTTCRKFGVGLTDSSVYVDGTTGITTLCNLIVANTATIGGTTTIGSSETIPNIMLNVNGHVQATNITLVSDIKVKRNIVEDSNIGSVVDNMKIYSYEYNHDELGRKRRYGFLAQELETIFPNSTFSCSGYNSMIMSNVPCIFNTKSVVLDFGKNFTLCEEDELIIGNKHYSIMSVSDSGTTARISWKKDPGSKLFINGIFYKTTKMVDYNQIVAALCSKVQSLSLKIDALTNCR